MALVITRESDHSDPSYYSDLSSDPSYDSDQSYVSGQVMTQLQAWPLIRVMTYRR